MKSDNNQESKVSDGFWLSWRAFLLLNLLVVLIWITYIWAISKFGPSEIAERGQLGDLFGGLTALFSGLAFAGLVFTLLVQKKELELQRHEVANLVREQENANRLLEAQGDQVVAQLEFLKHQNFENNFFQMLKQFSDYTQTIALGSDKKIFGKDALEYIDHNMKAYLRSEKATTNFDGQYEEFYKTFKNDLGPYFRIMYNILKFVDRSGEANPEFYVNILRAQLNSAELSILAINSLSSYGKEKMLPLVMNYNMVKHFDDFTCEKFGADVRNKMSLFPFFADGAYVPFEER